MSGEIIAEYGVLSKVTSDLNELVTATGQLVQLLQNQGHELRASNKWKGQTASAFYNELDNSLVPALQRLKECFGETATTTQQIAQTFDNAETEAASKYLQLTI